MKNGIAIILIFLSACAWTPKDMAWKTSLETDAPEGIGGNCLPVAQKLQTLYGGRIAVLAKQGQPTHAVLMIDDDRYLDNGALGYSGNQAKIKEKGWEFKRWWRP